MLSYATLMPNTRSAKKALRSSLRKRKFNNFWKKRIKESMKTLDDILETKNNDAAILNKNLTALQKVLDKAAKNNVIHKNKAKRLKSRYAKRITAQNKGKAAEKSSSPKKSKGSSSGKKKS
jgi:small subunit ribosomal protein S20